MKSNLNNKEIALIKLLRENGIILPYENDDLIFYKKIYKKDDIPSLPDSLNDPDAILKRGFISKTYETEINNQTTDDMARAARDGKSIPDSVLKKMREDRENSKKND